MTTIGSRNWRPGPGRVRGDQAVSRVKTGAGDDKLRVRAEASLAESERRLSRQIAVLAELRAAGSVTTEAEKSLVRLETAVQEQRSSCDMLLSKVSEADVAAKGGPLG